MRKWGLQKACPIGYTLLLLCLVEFLFHNWSAFQIKTFKRRNILFELCYSLPCFFFSVCQHTDMMLYVYMHVNTHTHVCRFTLNLIEIITLADKAWLWYHTYCAILQCQKPFHSIRVTWCQLLQEKEVL